MRRFLVFVFLLALTVPVTATGAVRGANDGTLSVRDLNGAITIKARGGVIGRCDQCGFVLDEWRTGEIDPIISGARGTDTDGDGEKELFAGRDAKWRVIGGSFQLIVRRGVDVDISAVGNGWVRIIGTKGTYVLNGGETVGVSPLGETFRLRAAAP